MAPGRRPALAALLAAALAATSGATATAAPKAPAPRLAAPAYILVEPSTGRVLAARAPDAERPIASTTKMMTALLVLERARLDDAYTVPPLSLEPVESRMGLSPGQRVTVRDLLVGLLLPSGNDAAITVAQGLAGSRARFVALMNQRARQLGLRHTHFANPVGLDAPGNHGSARDLVRLAEALRAHPLAARIVDEPRAAVRFGGRRHVLFSRNALLRRVRWVNGVKTGHTSTAGYLLVGSATRGPITLYSAVLGAPSEAARDAGTLALLRYGFSRLRVAQPIRAGQVLGHVAVQDRADLRIPLVAAAGVRRVALRGRPLRVQVQAPAEVAGPRPAGAVVGQALVRDGRQIVARVPLRLARAAPEVGLLERGARRLGSASPLTLLALAAALAGTLLVALRRRAVVR
jgi:D-alanyl-D-alanine carboxypeptidase (penicillin-binding protein 5/6)